MRKTTTRERILKVLGNRKTALGAKELAQRSKSHYHTTRNQLGMLLNEGIVKYNEYYIFRGDRQVTGYLVE
jgi:DNA-binding IclR family transcriptional regulator